MPRDGYLEDLPRRGNKLEGPAKPRALPATPQIGAGSPPDFRLASAAPDRGWRVVLSILLAIGVTAGALMLRQRSAA